MKAIIKYLVVVIGILLTSTSCTDFLTEDPRGLQMQETFYASDSEALGGLMGLYEEVQVTDCLGQNLILRNEAASDLLTYKPSAASDGVIFSKYMLGPEALHNLNRWRQAYSIVNGANSYISALESNSNSKIINKEQYIKEAKFFRALMYYHLVMTWGDVPLLTKPIDTKNTDVPRTSKTKVWEQVVQDLKDASTLPEKTKTPQGRITSGTVMTLLAKVYLMQSDFSNAGIALDRITGYSLMSNIRDVWSTTHKYNDESIWEINKEKGTLPLQRNGWLSQYMPTYASFKGANATYPVNDYLLMLTESNSARTKLFYTKKPLLSEINSKYKGEYTYYTALGNPVKMVFTSATLALCSHLMKFVDFSTVGEIFDSNDCPFNQVIFRYADVVLMKAEVECELNGLTTKALNYLNQIRNRAGETRYTLTGEVGLRNLTSVERLKEAIRNERALELVGEGHRLYDLKRWGSVYAITKLKASRQALILNTTPCYKPEDLVNIADFRLLWPIPESEMTGNKLMTKNPGY